MNNSQEIVIDEWDIKLDKKLAELKTCQESNNLKSCTPCGVFFECK